MIMYVSINMVVSQSVHVLSLPVYTCTYMSICLSVHAYEPRHAIMCLREINYVMRYDVVKSDVIISR